MSGRGRAKAEGRRGAGLAACAVMAFIAAAPAPIALAAPVGAAAAASPPWTIQPSPNATIPGGQLKSVSCSAADACTAVGTNLGPAGLNVTVAERWNGKSWRLQQTPNPPADTVPIASPELFGVSCPSSNFCEAVGAYQVATEGISLAERWNGRTWTLQSFPVPASSTTADLFEVSCTSATFCEAVGTYNNGIGESLSFAATWNGTAWRLQGTPVPDGATTVFMTALSCVSPKFCEAGGNSIGEGSFAMRWNGTSWSLQTLPEGGGAGAVSCVAATFCEMVGFGGADVWNGSGWSPQTVPQTAGSASVSLTGVSCSAARFCAAVGQYNDTSGNTLSISATWNGKSWALRTTPNPAGTSFTSLNAVSCAAASACEAAGNFMVDPPRWQALADSWSGTAWQAQHVVKPPTAVANTLNAVSCVSLVFCEAVGSHPDSSGTATLALALAWNGAAWKIQNTPDPAQAANGTRMALDGVSCVSALFCEAVGQSSSPIGGGAEVWHGTKWALQAVPGGPLTSVSCTSPKFCVAVGGNGHVDTWNGKSWLWAASTSGFTSLSSVACVSASFCEATGAGPAGDEAERWNGKSWSAQSTPTPANGSSPALSAVSCAAVTYCETVGSYTNSSFSVAPLAEVWKGTGWAVQPVPDPAASSVAGSASLSGVWCTSAKSCTAVGQYSLLVSNFTLGEVWNGASWSQRPTASVPYAGQNSLSGVSCRASNVCTAVGVTDDAGQVTATLIETGDLSSRILEKRCKGGVAGGQELAQGPDLGPSRCSPPRSLPVRAARWPAALSGGWKLPRT